MGIPRKPGGATEPKAKTISFTDLPVSQGARDLFAALPRSSDEVDACLSVLCEADEKDVRNLLWARRVGKL
jgi:hypothetical protein